MIYPARMKKITLLSLSRYEKNIIDALHHIGTVEITQVDLDLEGPEAFSPKDEQLITLLRKADEIVGYLSLFEPEDMPLSKILIHGPDSVEYEQDILDISAASYIKELEIKSRNLKERLTRIEKDIEKTKDSIQLVGQFEAFDVEISSLKDSDFVFYLAGRLHSSELEPLQKSLKKRSVSVFSSTKEEETTLIVAGLKAERDEILGHLLRRGFRRSIIPAVRGKSKDLMEKYRNKLAKLENDRNLVMESVSYLVEENFNDLNAVKEFLELEKAKADIKKRFGRSKKTFILEGFVPEKSIEKTIEAIKKVSEGTAYVKTEEPKIESEIPIMLDNPSIIRPFQILTRAYAMPRYNEVDPSFLIAFWFPLFFGVMLTDVVYGALLFLLSLFALKSFRTPGIRDMAKILVISSVWTLFFGALFGSYLGDFLPRFFKTTVGLFDPLVKADIALLLAILIGLIHLNIGLSFGVAEKIKKSDMKGMFQEHLWVILLELSVALLLLEQKLAAILLLAGIICMLFMKSSLLGILEINSAISKNLSYARLLALSLATTGIALAVNIIGSLFMGSLIGGVLSILILLGGHTFNFAINVFGAFIHSMRLHYVEFFSMFYGGGGKEFSPFKAKRRYTKKGGV